MGIADLCISLTAPEGATTVDHRDVPFSVETVEWQVYIHDGRPWRMVRCHGRDGDGKRSNVTWNRDYDRIPEWVPNPPEQWLDLAEHVAAQVYEATS